MNIINSRISSTCGLIKGALAGLQADYNNIIVRNGMSRVLAKRRPWYMKWPAYRHKFKDGVEYYGFTYYPKPGEIEPEWKPTELFLVRRTKPYSGNPYWEKRILKYFHLDQRRTDTSIIMNSEHNNKMLWQIKHLISITPITFPDGYPEDGDLSRCRLYENGEFRIDKNLECSGESLEAVENVQKNPQVPTKTMVESFARKQWTNPFMSNTYI